LRIVAFGKAAVTMAEAAAEMVSVEDFPGPGVVAVNPENFAPQDRFRVFAAGHPVPDAVGVAAAEAVEEYLTDSQESDALLVLVSGGGSALLPAPAPGISLEDKMETTRLLLACGAPIQKVNCVRKHLSGLKGGGLARIASPARVESLILSDVIGDDLGSVASGPTVPDLTTFLDARDILQEHDLLGSVPAAVRRRIEQGVAGEIPETPTEQDPFFSRVANRLVGSNAQSLESARRSAESLGYRVHIASSELCGEARLAAAALHATARRQRSGPEPLAILAGGETTVTVRGKGTGGRNQEMALAFARVCQSEPLTGDWVFLSGGTDGRDGPTDAAGGVVDAGTVERIRRSGLDPVQELNRNNSNVALAASEDLLVTGPTGTNVADLQVLLLAGDPLVG
jgi:hydroxypyruvate reductase